MEERRLKMSTGREHQSQLGVKTQLNLYGSRLIRIHILLYERLVETFSILWYFSSNIVGRFDAEKSLRKMGPPYFTEDQKRQRVLCAQNKYSFWSPLDKNA